MSFHKIDQLKDQQWTDGRPFFHKASLYEDVRSMKYHGLWISADLFRFRFWGLGLLQLHRHHRLLPVGMSVIFPPTTYHQIHEGTEQIWKTCSIPTNRWHPPIILFWTTLGLLYQCASRGQHKHHHRTVNKNTLSSQSQRRCMKFATA